MASSHGAVSVLLCLLSLSALQTTSEANTIEDVPVRAHEHDTSELPVGVKVTATKLSLLEGLETQLHCEVNGVFPTNVTEFLWYKVLDGVEYRLAEREHKLYRPFSLVRRYTVDFTVDANMTHYDVSSHLVIRDVQKMDEGLIGCRVNNRTQDSVNLFVSGKILRSYLVKKTRFHSPMFYGGGSIVDVWWPKEREAELMCKVESTSENIAVWLQLGNKTISSEASPVALEWSYDTGEGTGLPKRTANIYKGAAPGFTISREMDGLPLTCFTQLIRGPEETHRTGAFLELQHRAEGSCTSEIAADDHHILPSEKMASSQSSGGVEAGRGPVVNVACVINLTKPYWRYEWMWTEVGVLNRTAVVKGTGASTNYPPGYSGNVTELDDGSVKFSLVIMPPSSLTTPLYTLTVVNMVGSASFNITNPTLLSTEGEVASNINSGSEGRRPALSWILLGAVSAVHRHVSMYL